MKATLCLSLVVLLVCSAFPASATLPRPQTQVVCFNGAVDHSDSCAALFRLDGEMICSFEGQLSVIAWSFIERHGDKGFYHFARRSPLGAANVATDSKDVEYGDGRVVVFQSAHQTILIEPYVPWPVRLTTRSSEPALRSGR